MKRISIAILGALVLPWLGGVLWAEEQPASPPQPAGSAATVVFMDACPQRSCWNVSCNCWDDCGNGSIFSNLDAGASVLILKPHFENNAAFTTLSPPTLGATAHQTTETDFHSSFEASPMVWVGWRCDNSFGVRTSYFTFDHTSRNFAFTNPPAGPGAVIVNEAPGLPDPRLLVFPAPATGDFSSPGVIATRAFGQGVASPDALAFGSSLRVDTITLEATYDCTCGSAAIVLAGGARCLYERQAYHALLKNAVTIGTASAIEVDTLDYKHTFNGGGPTLAIYARQPLSDTAVSVYGNLRGSLLVGKSRQNFRATQLVSDTGITPGGGLPPLTQNTFFADQFASGRDDTIPVCELEIGLEYAEDLGACRLFAQTGVVGQTYFGGGSASSETGNFSLFGLQVTIGLSR